MCYAYTYVCPSVSAYVRMISTREKTRDRRKIKKKKTAGVRSVLTDSVSCDFARTVVCRTRPRSIRLLRPPLTEKTFTTILFTAVVGPFRSVLSLFTNVSRYTIYYCFGRLSFLLQNYLQCNTIKIYYQFKQIIFTSFS